MSAGIRQNCSKAISGRIAGEFSIDQSIFRRYGVHVHVPAGAIPKDGPSAGVTMTTALTSLYTGLPVRSDTAIDRLKVTLSGLVLPVGGIKEKMLAARRLGIRRVIIPKQNEKDLRDLPEDARNEMEFIVAEHVHEVLRAAIPQGIRRAESPLRHSGVTCFAGPGCARGKHALKFALSIWGTGNGPEIRARGHKCISDQPIEVGGYDEGVTPPELPRWRRSVRVLDITPRII